MILFVGSKRHLKFFPFVQINVVTSTLKKRMDLILLPTTGTTIHYLFNVVGAGQKRGLTVSRGQGRSFHALPNPALAGQSGRNAFSPNYRSNCQLLCARAVIVVSDKAVTTTRVMRREPRPIR